MAAFFVLCLVIVVVVVGVNGFVGVGVVLGMS